MKQAVIVIHGIGEQVPMATLRGLVASVLDERKHPGSPKFYNKPDHMNAGYEQRLLRSLSEGKRPTTDFFEFYWAHHMRDSKLSQVYAWIWKLAWRWPWRIPSALLPAYVALWGGALLIVWLLIGGVLDADFTLAEFYRQQFLYLSVLAAGAQALVSYVTLGYVADAARYLTPSPDNIEQRNNIRREGIELLRNLHTTGKYARIIIVGHSLGSVIGYDLIRLLWDDYRNPRGIGHVELRELGEFEAQQQLLFAADSGLSVGARIERFQQRQYDLWRAMRNPDLDYPWLISDFVTLGSPMAHGSFLLAASAGDFGQRVNEYEFPVCPPFGGDDLTYPKTYEIDRDGTRHKVTRSVPNHGAPFCCTRWANLYFRYRWLLCGDLIGGKLQGSFGRGIKDIEVKPHLRPASGQTAWQTIKGHLGYFRDLTLFSHVCYWSSYPQSRLTRWLNDRLFAGARKESLTALKSEMHL